MKPMHDHAERDALPCLCCGTTVARCEAAPVPRLRSILRFVAFCAVMLGTAFALGRANADELPRDSTYHLAVPLVDQDGRAFAFADGRGRARIVSMFYTSCKYVCPLIIDTLLKTERGLEPAERARLDVLLVSLDPDNDTPDALKRVADKRRLDTSRWRLARTDAAHVRRLAAMLGIQYKQLENREFSHSSALVLLDPQGRILARSDRLGEADPDFVAAASRALGDQASAKR